MENMRRKKIDVIIDKNVYTVIGIESEEYMHKVASYIDRKIQEIKSSPSCKRLNQNMIGTLTALNIGDDLFKLFDINEKLKQESHGKEIQISNYEYELHKLQSENIELNKKIQELELSLTMSKQETEHYPNAFENKENKKGNKKGKKGKKIRRS